MEISHYKASWVNGENYPEPAWPETRPNGWNRETIVESSRGVDYSAPLSHHRAYLLGTTAVPSIL